MSGFSPRVPPPYNELPSFPEALSHAIVSIRLATATLSRCALERKAMPDSSDVLARAVRLTEMVAEQFDSIAHLFVSIRNMSRDDPAVNILAELGGNLSECAYESAHAAHDDLKNSGRNVENPDETGKRESRGMEPPLRGDSNAVSRGT